MPQYLPSSHSGDDDHIPPADLYRAAVDEYRFQVTYNWSRTQYLLAFNAGIFTAAIVASQWSRYAIGIYALGAVTAGLSLLVVRTQHSYYRAARDRMRRAEAIYRVPPDLRADTTSTLGHRPRGASVNQVVLLILSALIVANIVGGIVLAVA